MADFNGDGTIDMAVVDDNIATLTILLGKGDGTFASAPNVNVRFNPLVVRTGDFNGDGKVGLVVVNLGDTGNDPTIVNSNVTILLGNGDGTFTAAASVDVGWAPDDMAVGDFNGDGNADLAVANFNTDTVTVLLGNGDGTFKTVAESPATGIAPIAMVTGDFNRDGILDLVTANFGLVRQQFCWAMAMGPSPPRRARLPQRRPRNAW